VAANTSLPPTGGSGPAVTTNCSNCFGATSPPSHTIELTASSYCRSPIVIGGSSGRVVTVAVHPRTLGTPACGIGVSAGKVSSSRVVDTPDRSLDRRTAKDCVSPPVADPGTMLTRADAAGASASIETTDTSAVASIVVRMRDEVLRGWAMGDS
jgi:hypothetical protein